MKPRSLLFLVPFALPAFVLAAPNKPAASGPRKASNVSTATTRSGRKVPSFLEGVNPSVGFHYQGISLKKRNNSLKETHSNLQTSDVKGVNLGLGVEHKLAALPGANLASRVFYQFGKDSQEATATVRQVPGVSVDTTTTAHVLRVAEALQFGVGMTSGTLRPTVEVGAGHAWFQDELSANKNMGNIEAKASGFFFDVGGGLDFKFYNGITPYVMAYYRFLTVPKKEVKVVGTQQFQEAQAEFDYQLSGTGVNVGLGYTF